MAASVALPSVCTSTALATTQGTICSAASVAAGQGGGLPGGDHGAVVTFRPAAQDHAHGSSCIPTPLCGLVTRHHPATHPGGILLRAKGSLPLPTGTVGQQAKPPEVKGFSVPPLHKPRHMAQTTPKRMRPKTPPKRGGKPVPPAAPPPEYLLLRAHGGWPPSPSTVSSSSSTAVRPVVKAYEPAMHIHVHVNFPTVGQGRTRSRSRSARRHRIS